MKDYSWTHDALDLAQDYHPQTIAVRAGQFRTAEGEHNEPIYATSSYVYASAEAAAAHFNGQAVGNVYSRHTNPSVRLFERRLAALENAERCVATASGMGAICALALAFLKSGDHMICARQVFGSTKALFDGYFAKFGVSVDYADLTDLSDWQIKIRSNTKLLFIESPSNPLGQVGDIRALANLAHAHGALLAVDNCFATPILQKPLDLGADIVMHSASKYIDGQGRVLGGALLGSDSLMEQAFGVIRTAGISLSAFNAWILGKGLETLDLRMRAHCQNAMAVANFLSTHKSVVRVHYAGLPTDNGHALAKCQQSGLYGAIIGVVLADKAAAWRLIDSTRLISITNNLGDAKTTITHPATTTHFRISQEDRNSAGVVDGLVRLSIGLEHADDIIKDLARGLD